MRVHTTTICTLYNNDGVFRSEQLHANNSPYWRASAGDHTVLSQWITMPVCCVTTERTTMILIPCSHIYLQELVDWGRRDKRISLVRCRDGGNTATFTGGWHLVIARSLITRWLLLLLLPPQSNGGSYPLRNSIQ